MCVFNRGHFGKTVRLYIGCQKFNSVGFGTYYGGGSKMRSYTSALSVDEVSLG